MVNYGLLMAMGYGGWSVVGLAAKECERGERHGRRAAGGHGRSIKLKSTTRLGGKLFSS